MHRNMALARTAEHPDVVFLGDSITEHWVGTELGEPDPDEEGNAKVFRELFMGGGKVRGLALGIAGDRVRDAQYLLCCLRMELIVS
jgi:lysophospholipase L1-like esterase